MIPEMPSQRNAKPTARLLEQLDDARAALAAGQEVGP
jgi:hypothetical protein